MHVCVYCASSDHVPALYLDAAHTFGEGMARRGWTLVYGGGSIGLMGAVARAVHGAGGRVIGVIPQTLLEREVGYREADELIVTATLRERKQIMDDRANAFVALPGGFGTLEELLEIMTLRMLGYHNKPIVIVNIGGYFEPLLTQFEYIFSQNFAHERYRRLYTVKADSEAALTYLEHMVPGSSPGR